MKILSLDVETNGLYGESLAIGAIVRSDGHDVIFQGKVLDSFFTETWTRENVLPQLSTMEVTHNTPAELEESFWAFWLKHKKDAVVIAHCGSPVESGLFRRCVERNLSERIFEGPYPAIHDVATLLLFYGYDPSSCDTYLKDRKINIKYKGSTHNPIYDALAALAVWEALF